MFLFPFQIIKFYSGRERNAYKSVSPTSLWAFLENESYMICLCAKSRHLISEWQMNEFIPVLTFCSSKVMSVDSHSELTAVSSFF